MAKCISSTPLYSRYDTATRLLHWSIALFVLLTWPLGLMIGYVKQAVLPEFYILHEGIGFIVLWLMLVRVGNKLFSKKLPAEGPAILRLAAGCVHGLLYGFLIIMPVSGFLATNAHGFPLNWFGLINVWSPIGKSPDIARDLSAVHEWSAWILLVLFALHVGAVLMHHVVKKDETLYRIL
ncbi:MAG: cytochrome b [Roseibium sp.]|uniref:cytochrome b n=1 Tax=Roseibium sp. TaxID=1936156 RepID=UPI00262CE7A6|nr:cytochrome b [Roseibium sp.]MCV0428734.1 cytochrome b [Roseibium sp.]